MSDWTSRIVGHGEVVPEKLVANPLNWREHPQRQRDTLAAVLDRVGWVQDVVVNQRTGRIVDGHLRVALALSRKEPAVPVVYVDLSPEEEAMVLASLDPLGSMAIQDGEKLRPLLEVIEADGPLADLLESLTGVPAWSTVADFGAAPTTVTQEQVARRTEDFAGRFEERSLVRAEGYIELACPDCGASFSIHEDELDNPITRSEMV